MFAPLFCFPQKKRIVFVLDIIWTKKSKNVIILWVQSLPVIDGPQWAEIKKWIVALVYWFRSAPMLGKMKLVFGFNTFFHCINLYWSKFFSSYCFYYSLSCYKFFFKIWVFRFKNSFLKSTFLLKKKLSLLLFIYKKWASVKLGCYLVLYVSFFFSMFFSFFFLSLVTLSNFYC